MVNLTLRQIGRSEDLTPFEVNWVVLAYTIAFAAVLLIAGTIIDNVGLRSAFLLGNALLIAANILCAWPPNKYGLICGRAIAGLGGGINAVSLTPLITYTFHDEKDRNKGLSMIMVSGPLGIICGIILGAVMTDSSLGWRAIFWLTLIVSAIVFCLALILVPSFKKQTEEESPPFDTIGVILGCIGVPCLAYGLNDGPNRGWADPAVLTTLIVGILALIGFVIYERHITDPFIPLPFVSLGNMPLMLLTFFVAGGGYSAWFLVVTQAFLNAFGYSAIRSALYLLPATFGFVASAAVANFLMTRVSDRTQIGLSILWLGAFLIPWAIIPVDVDRWYPIVFALLFVLGNVPAVVRAQASMLNFIPRKQHAQASSCFGIAYQTGATFLIAIANIVTKSTSHNSISPDKILVGYKYSFWMLFAVMMVSALVFVLCYRVAVTTEDGVLEMKTRREDNSEDPKLKVVQNGPAAD
ncbi:hypothetical protein NHQ30_007472 [Ciborinia camelliae]|nr:hypothetical protein NHQ30_007472 [Ciborinia camelliae]